MFRIVCTRAPSKFLNQNCYREAIRLQKAFRQYSSKPDICPPKKKKHPSNWHLAGAVALLAGGTLAYAKYDPEFREWLTCLAPYTENVIRFVFQEDKTFVESFIEFLDSLKESVLGVFDSSRGKGGKNIPVAPKAYTPPSPAFRSLANKKLAEEPYAEIRLEKKEECQAEPTVTIAGDAKPTEINLQDTHPKNIAALEAQMAESASNTVQAYNRAVYALKNYNTDVKVIVEDSPDKIDPSIWTSLRDKTKAKAQALKDAEECAEQTRKHMAKLKDVLSQVVCEDNETVKATALINIKSVEEDIEKAKKELHVEQAKSNVTDKYWKKVEEARNHFIDELEILFPNMNINEKKLALDGADLDLFILHAFTNVLFYQKQLCKLQTIEEERVKQALEAARRGNKDILTDTQIHVLVEKEKKKLAEEYAKRCLCLRAESEKELRRQLKLQSETFADHLNDALAAKEMEMQRDFARQVDEKVMEERCKFKLQLSALAGRVRGMDEALKARIQSDKAARQAQVLWSACQALFRSLKAGCPGLSWKEQMRPLEAEITAVQQAAAQGDELVKVVLSGIPKEAKERGVLPEDALRERFLKVEKVCRHVALLPATGGRLPLHVLSLIHSILLLKAVNPISQAELNDEEVDFSHLSTDDVLQRARYWLDRGDFAQTLRYMNLLEGAPRTIAYQWMDETRIMLETQQAANILMAHAAANGLLYL